MGEPLFCLQRKKVGEDIMKKNHIHYIIAVSLLAIGMG